MATVRMAAGNLLGTVSDTANAISTTMNTVAGGISILNSKVQVMHQKQRIAGIAEIENFEEQLIKNSNLENVKLEETVRAYIGNDPEKQAAYNKYDEKLRAAIAKFRKESTEE